MNEKILVVDDEKEIADLLEVYLKNDNYTVYKYYSGIEALKCIEETEIDLAILDIMLPDIDGFRICQKIREKFYFPVIMLTAKIEDGDKIMGLTIGADDYITKPFNPSLVCIVEFASLFSPDCFSTEQADKITIIPNTNKNANLFRYLFTDIPPCYLIFQEKNKRLLS